MSEDLNLKSEEIRQISYNNEAARKALHAFGLIIPIFYFFVPRPITLIVLLPLCVGAIVMDLARMTNQPLWTKFLTKLFGYMIRPTEKTGFTGASYILSTNFLVILMYSKPVAICAMAFIVLGDPAAALVGRRWGRHKYGRKSLEGSLGFLLAAVLPALLFYFIYRHQLPLIVGLSGAIVATLVEACSSSSDDNLTVPIISGLYMQILLAFA